MPSADPPHAAAWRHVRPNSSTQSTFKFGISATSFLKQSRKPFIAAIWIGSIPWEPGLYKNYFIILHNSGTTKQRTLITMKSTFSDELETVLNISLIILAYDTTMLQCHENSSWDFSPIHVTTKQKAGICNSFQVIMQADTQTQTRTYTPLLSALYMHLFSHWLTHIHKCVEHSSSRLLTMSSAVFIIYCLQSVTLSWLADYGRLVYPTFRARTNRFKNSIKLIPRLTTATVVTLHSIAYCVPVCVSVCAIVLI